MNQEKLVKEVRYLKIYATISTVIFAVFLFSAFATSKLQKFEEINVERINVVEKDGKLKMVISNKALQHPGQIDGIYYKEREGKRAAGMIFFSERGDEIGGLTFGGNDGQGQFGSLTFDKFRSDQTVQFIHTEDKDGNYFAGLRMNDQYLPIADYLKKMEEINKLPTKEAAEAATKEYMAKLQEKGLLGGNRLSIGRTRDKASFIGLKDAKGKSRIEISVEENGNPKLNFLDENGKVIYSLPEDAKK
jgi:hypothetical protein